MNPIAGQDLIGAGFPILPMFRKEDPDMTVVKARGAGISLSKVAGQGNK